ncbi:MAG: DUF2911 domain-containing protein [Bacteroidota bacterium]
MKTNLVFIFCLLFVGTFSLQAQDLKFSDLDKSPMDAAHYPRRAAYKNYLDADDPDRRQQIKVLYCRPMKKGRDVFGGLEPWGQDWRLGANEATEVSFFQPVEIGGVTIAPGTYTMFAQLYPDQWIVKISSERFIGGSANRDVSKDLVAVAVPTQTLPEVMESFTIGFQKVDDNNVDMVFAWDKTRVDLPINLSPAMMDGDNASPMDLVQFPDRSRLRNFVEEKDLEANEPQVRVVYSRPQMKGRKIFGELLPYGKMWRVGANETTLVTFFEPVSIDGKDIKAGTYGLFAEVNEGEWDFILHKNTQSWGDANHDAKDNVATFRVKTEKTPNTLEALSIALMEKDGLVHLVVGWEDTMARLPIKVNKSVK